VSRENKIQRWERQNKGTRSLRSRLLRASHKEMRRIQHPAPELREPPASRDGGGQSGKDACSSPRHLDPGHSRQQQQGKTHEDGSVESPVESCLAASVLASPCPFGPLGTLTSLWVVVFQTTRVRASFLVLFPCRQREAKGR